MAIRRRVLVLYHVSNENRVATDSDPEHDQFLADSLQRVAWFFARRAYCVERSKNTMFVRPSVRPPSVRPSVRVTLTGFSDKKLKNCFKSEVIGLPKPSKSGIQLISDKKLSNHNRLRSVTSVILSEPFGPPACGCNLVLELEARRRIQRSVTLNVYIFL